MNKRSAFAPRREYKPFVRRKAPVRPPGMLTARERALRYVAAIAAYEVLLRHPLSRIEAQTVAVRARDLIRGEAICLIACFPPSEGALFYIEAAGRIVEIASRFDDSSYCECLDEVTPAPPKPTWRQRLGYRVHGASIRTLHRCRRVAYFVTRGRAGSKTGW